MNVEKIRQNLGISRDEFIERMGISIPTYYQILKDPKVCLKYTPQMMEEFQFSELTIKEFKVNKDEFRTDSD